MVTFIRLCFGMSVAIDNIIANPAPEDEKSLPDEAEDDEILTI